MYHLPRGRALDPHLLIDALLKEGVNASLDGDRVVMVLPVELFYKDDFKSTLELREWKPEVVGEVQATISYLSDVILENIVLQYSLPEKAPAGVGVRTVQVRRAMEECGYVQGDERQIAKKYSSGDSNLDSLFDELDSLQIDKENLVAQHRFEEAAMALQKHRKLRRQIEDLLRESFGKD